MLRIVILNGPNAGSRRDLPEGKMHLIGRVGGVLPLSDGLASRVHAELTAVDGRWYVNDMCSTNGTFLNDQRVTQQTPLKNGDQLQIGKTTVLIALSQTARKSKIGHLPMDAPAPRRKLGHLLQQSA